MVSVAGAAFGASAAVSLMNSAGNIANSVMRRTKSLGDLLTGRSYSSNQIERLQHYRRLCAKCCTSQVHLEFFDFDEVEQRPVKSKDDLFEQCPRFENSDSPFNLCRERRAVVRHIQRLCKYQWKAQEDRPLCSPEMYVAAELREWSKCIPVDPSSLFANMLEERIRYLTQVNIYTKTTKKFSDVLHIADVLEGMRQLLSSCRDKAKYHELRQLLPRIHGETNAICESMDIVLPCLLSTAKDPPRSAASLDVAVVVAPERNQCQGAIDISESLFRTCKELQDLNERMLNRYLLHTDGLPITSYSIVNPDVVHALRQCLVALTAKLQRIDTQLKRLTAQCHALYKGEEASVATRQWRSNYDDAREEVDNVHAAINTCLQCIGDVDNFLLEKAPLGKRCALLLSQEQSNKRARQELILTVTTDASSNASRDSSNMLGSFLY